ncbi:hypothetical protein KJ830_01555 [bacterium]|nr:hypothetical protein [Nitrospinota bacterium]MBU4509711.1 hypothetical protein [bacterium]
MSHLQNIVEQLRSIPLKNVLNHIRPKICQQLQILRDKGILKFKGNGEYSFI